MPMVCRVIYCNNFIIITGHHAGKRAEPLNLADEGAVAEGEDE